MGSSVVLATAGYDHTIRCVCIHVDVWKNLLPPSYPMTLVLSRQSCSQVLGGDDGNMLSHPTVRRVAGMQHGIPLPLSPSALSYRLLSRMLDAGDTMQRLSSGWERLL